jgi:hypothetical protein
MTSGEQKLKILAELWIDWRDDEGFAEFVEYNDIGLPLAYCIHSEIVPPTPRADLYISETFDILLASLALEDTKEGGFDSLEEMLQMAGDRFSE